jgi:hypothetical protein
MISQIATAANPAYHHHRLRGPGSVALHAQERTDLVALSFRVPELLGARAAAVVFACVVVVVVLFITVLSFSLLVIEC